MAGERTLSMEICWKNLKIPLIERTLLGTEGENGIEEERKAGRRFGGKKTMRNGEGWPEVGEGEGEGGEK